MANTADTSPSWDGARASISFFIDLDATFYEEWPKLTPLGRVALMTWYVTNRLSRLRFRAGMDEASRRREMEKLAAFWGEHTPYPRRTFRQGGHYVVQGKTYELLAAFFDPYNGSVLGFCSDGHLRRFQKSHFTASDYRALAAGK